MSCIVCPKICIGYPKNTSFVLKSVTALLNLQGMQTGFHFLKRAVSCAASHIWNKEKQKAAVMFNVSLLQMHLIEKA